LATPNYGYEKRQKELAKKRKKEDKLKSKSERKSGVDEAPASSATWVDQEAPAAMPPAPTPAT
jgi:hypothetical protein